MMKLFQRTRVFFLHLFVALLIVIGSSQAIAQPGGGGNPCPGGPPCNPHNPVPISGIEFLIGAGAIFGVKKLLSKSRTKE